MPKQRQKQALLGGGVGRPATRDLRDIVSRRNAARPDAPDTLRTLGTRTSNLRRTEPPKPPRRGPVSALPNSAS
jgi:hypothetical protein